MKRLAALLILCLAAPLTADIVTLNDGTKLEGEIKRTANGYVVTDASGKTTVVAASDIRGIELKRKSTSATQPQPSSSRQAAEKAPLASTPESQAAGNAAAMEILPLLTGGSTGQAGAMLDKALASSPANPALLYLKGVVLFRQNQLVPARKAFESAAAALPSHAPTHNNLAVILFQTRAQMPALLEYDKAMLADPGDQQVLDNVLEALHALPPSYANNAVAKKVAAHFTQQEAELEQKMAAQGLKRYGSQWVSDAEFAKVQSAQKAAQDNLQSTTNHAVNIQNRLAEIDRQLAFDNQAIAAMTQQQSQVDPRTGRVVAMPLPPRYYELQREIQQLSSEKALKQQELQQLPQQAAAAQQRAGDGGTFSGKQSILDERFMPGAPPVTQPTTRPAR